MGTTKTETSKMDPLQQKFMEEALLPFAREIAGTPYETFEGERVAGFTPTQQRALYGYGQLSLPSELATASGIVEDVATMTPEELSAQRAQYAQEYTDLIMDPTRARLLREQDIARSTEAGQMTRALGGAGFGLSRRGVAEGEREAARDVAVRELEARIAGQGLDYGTQRLMSDIGLRTGAAGQLAGFGMTGLGAQTDILGRQLAAGDVGRTLEQARLDVPYQDYLARMQYPLTQFGVLTGAAGAVPAGYGTTTARDPMGTFGNILGGIGAVGQGGGLGAFFSDAALKKNIKKVGQINGVNLYRWDWNEEAKSIGADQYPSTGVIAQEIEKKYPEHVIIDKTGYRRVNYSGLYSDLGGI